MRGSGFWLRRSIACCLVLVMMGPFAEGSSSEAVQTQAASSQQGSTEAVQPPALSQQTPNPPAGLTPSSGAQPDVTAPANPSPSTSGTPPASTATQPVEQGSAPQSQAPQPVPQQGTGDNAPVGSAAAPYEKGVGNAASRPAGAAIAPAKQKRTRSILIRVGIVVGAAAAIGTVVALSSASPSRPN